MDDCFPCLCDQGLGFAQDIGVAFAVVVGVAGDLGDEMPAAVDQLEGVVFTDHEDDIALVG